MPRSPQTMPQPPIEVSNIAKWWPVMAGSILLSDIVSLMLGRNLGLEIVAIHPNPGEFYPSNGKNLGAPRISPTVPARLGKPLAPVLVFPSNKTTGFAPKARGGTS